jgi:hypothetical protein
MGRRRPRLSQPVTAQAVQKRKDVIAVSLPSSGSAAKGSSAGSGHNETAARGKGTSRQIGTYHTVQKAVLALEKQQQQQQQHKHGFVCSRALLCVHVLTCALVCQGRGAERQRSGQQC